MDDQIKILSDDLDMVTQILANLTKKIEVIEKRLDALYEANRLSQLQGPYNG